MPGAIINSGSRHSSQTGYGLDLSGGPLRHCVKETAAIRNAVM
jgi:hypothetical protein